MIDTIYFDNWNTIVTAPHLMRRGSDTEIFNQYLVKQGIDIPYDIFLEAYIPIAREQERKAVNEGHRELDYRQRIEDVFRKLEIKEANQYSHEAWMYYLEKWPEQTEFFQGVSEMLSELKQEYKLGVITNFMDGPTCREVFTKLGFNDVFDSLVVSHELGYMKPARLLFEKAMSETHSVPENCIMVGDTYSADVVGGNLAGMKTVLVDIYNNQAEYYKNATVVIKNINDFPNALVKLKSG